MKNLLIRAGISPLDNFDATHMLLNNSIGGNVGNLVYAYSIFRTLMTDGTTITPTYYKDYPKNIDEINEKYDAFILPLADAFREDFAPTLRTLTKFIKKLKIPVIVIGVGLRAPFEPKLDEGFPFDNDVRSFVKAVLEKSTMIGVRGEITAKYLNRLGFREGVDHTVIGCPSMYAFGPNLEIRKTTITPESMVCVNSSRFSPVNVLEFITRSMDVFSDHYFIPQWRTEMSLTYTGSPNIPKSKNHYPGKMSHPVYKNARVRFFLNVPTWLDFLRQADLSFGARLHGNIASTLAGTPSLIIPKDARMRELTHYHNLTHIMADEITDQTHILDIIEKSDFQQVSKNQPENFNRFIEFLNKNNLDHIYQNDQYPSIAPLDHALSQIELQPPIVPITGVSAEEVVKRFKKYYPALEKKQKQQLKEKDQLIKSQQAKLNRKSVRLALKASQMLKFK